MTATAAVQGFGLMGFTWRNDRVPDERAFTAMKEAIERGATIWSSSSMYGHEPDPPTAGLLLLQRYFKKYPEDAPKVTLCVRACIKDLLPRTTQEGVRESWEECNKILGDVKRINVFGPARFDKNVPVEVTVGALNELKDEGKIDDIVLSEVRAETIRRAAAVTAIKYAEIEFSLWFTEMLDNGVAEAARDNNVTILTYSPLGYGFLAGRVKKLEELPHNGRFQSDTFDKNLGLANRIQEVASKKKVTAAQLALAWIRSHSNVGPCGTLIPIPGATLAERVRENTVLVDLTADERLEIDDIVKRTVIVGHRQIPNFDDNVWT